MFRDFVGENEFLVILLGGLAVAFGGIIIGLNLQSENEFASWGRLTGFILVMLGILAELVIVYSTHKKINELKDREIPRLDLRLNTIDSRLSDLQLQINNLDSKHDNHTHPLENTLNKLVDKKMELEFLKRDLKKTD